MTLQAVLLPLFVPGRADFRPVALARAVARGALRQRSPRATSRSARRFGPERSQQIANCFANQFELPVLFYVLVTLAIIANKDDLLFVVLSWVFVAQPAPACGHPHGPNIVPLRGAAYGVGARSCWWRCGSSLRSEAIG